MNSGDSQLGFSIKCRSFDRICKSKGNNGQDLLPYFKKAEEFRLQDNRSKSKISGVEWGDVGWSTTAVG
jgi:hypothetical protein